MEKFRYKWPISIAMLNYQRVYSNHRYRTVAILESKRHMFFRFRFPCWKKLFYVFLIALVEHDQTSFFPGLRMWFVSHVFHLFGGFPYVFQRVFGGFPSPSPDRYLGLETLCREPSLSGEKQLFTFEIFQQKWGEMGWLVGGLEHEYDFSISWE